MNTPEQVRSIFGERLKSLRIDKKLTQTQCAEILDVEKSKYNKWENGIACPDAPTIRMLAEYFQTSTDYLVGKVDMISSGNVDIGQETGLSEMAIERIRQMNAMGFIDLLNQMIASTKMMSALSQLSHIESPNLVEGYHAIVPEADFEALKDGGKGQAWLVDVNVIERIFSTRAKEEMAQLIDELAHAIHDKKKAEGE
jgi:transcriptional regulator with XRE-family HTH domain